MRSTNPGSSVNAQGLKSMFKRVLFPILGIDDEVGGHSWKTNLKSTEDDDA